MPAVGVVYGSLQGSWDHIRMHVDATDPIVWTHHAGFVRFGRLEMLP